MERFHFIFYYPDAHVYRMKYQHPVIAYSFFLKFPKEFAEATKTAKTIEDFLALAALHYSP